MTHAVTAIGKTGSLIAGEGRPIVLLHSSMGSKGQWRELIERMRGTHRLIAIDLHGYGDTPMPMDQDGFSLADEVRLVKAALARTLAPGESFHLVGHSYGGTVALTLAYAEQQRVRSLSLFEPVAFHLLAGGDPGLAEVQAVRRAVQADLQADGDTQAGAARFIDYWSGRGAFSQLPADKQAALSRLLPKVALDFQAVAGEPLSLPHYRNIAVPACLIGGRVSPLSARRVLAVLSATLPEAQTHWVAAGHMAPVTHPLLVNPIIEGFIHQVDALRVSFGPSSGWDADEDQAQLYAA